MSLVVEGEVEETILMVEEEEKICWVTEETEVPISGEKPMASIIVIMHEAEPTTGNGRTTLDITTMSLLVTKDTDWMPKRW